MDPCPFVRILIGNLAVMLPKSTYSYYCKIKFKNFPTQSSQLQIFSETTPIENQVQACFSLNKSEFEKIVEKSCSTKKPFCLKIEIYAGPLGKTTCGLSCGRLLGSLSLPLELKGFGNKGLVVQNGWVEVNDLKVHMNVRAEPDPRFVFQFDGEPECSPQVFQVNGNVKQAVFTCKFGFRNSCDRNLRSRSLNSEQSTSRSWISSFKSNKNKSVKERKGWSITIHDLSGSPVATASMVTPFVPSPGTNRVSRSNPGAWLILRPGQGTWKPWGKLEAWLDNTNRVGYKFELLPDTTTGSIETVKLADSSVSTINGGKFMMDVNSTCACTPMTSASSSGDFGSGSESEGVGSWVNFLYRGFVMSSTVEGGGRCSKPEVEVGVHHVSCTEDAAAFVALAAAMDLSMDACKLFSGKLRKELRQEDQECCVV